MSSTGEEVFGPPDPTLREPLPQGPDEPGPQGEHYPDLQGPGLEDRAGGNLRPEDEQFYTDVQDLSTPFDEFLSQRSAELEKARLKALEEGDQRTAAGIQAEQIANTKIGQAWVDQFGARPEVRTAWTATPNPTAEMKRLTEVGRRYYEQADMVLDQNGWKDLEQWFYKDVIEPYKKRNQSQLMVPTEGMDPQQRFLAQEQLKPLVMDPQLVAEKRQQLAQIDAQMKRVHPGLSVFNYGPTMKVAKWINREASLGGGYIQSDVQEGEGFLGGAGGEAAAVLHQGGEAAFEFPLQLVYGGLHLMGVEAPTNYIEGPNGEIISNGGKVPGMTEAWITISAKLSGEDVQRRLAEHIKARRIEESRLSMIQQMSRGVSSVVGMAYGFGLPAGAAMGAGQKLGIGMMQNGLARLAVSGHPKAAKALGVMSTYAGAAVTNGLNESLAFGRQEGYLKAFMGGAAIAPILMVFGAAGKRMGERADKAWSKLLKQDKMPARLRQALEGGVEGLGFGAMADVHAWQQFEGSLWQFLQDPNETRWLNYATSVMGLSLFKGAMQRSPVEQALDPAAIASSRSQFRRIFARKVSEAEEAEVAPDVPRETPEGEVPGEAGVGEQKPLSDRDRELLEAAKAAGDQVGKPKTAEEMGVELERMRLEDEAAAKRAELAQAEGLPDEGPELPEQEELRRLRTEGPSPENRARMVELMRRAKGAFLGKVGETQQKLGEKVQRGVEGPSKAPMESASPERLARRRTLREAARQAGVDYEMTRALGDALRTLGDPTKPEAEREAAFERIRGLEEDLDVQEALADPALNPQLLDELRERHLERVQAGEIEPQRDPEMAAPTEGGPAPESVDPYYGERYGPDSLRAGVNPYRQQEEIATDRALDRTLSEIFEIMEGKRDRPGFRIPFSRKRVGSRKGSPVQVKLLSGKITVSGGTKGTLGVFKIYENLARTKEELDLMVALHEWGHVIHRQLGAGEGGDRFWKLTKAEEKLLGDDARQEVQGILQRYPGWEKLTRSQLMTEAWAEWHTRNLMGDDTLRTEFPTLSRKMDQWLNAPEQRAFRDGQYRDLMVAVRQWRDMGSERRTTLTWRNESRKPQTYDKPGFISDATDAVVKAFFDDKILLKKSQERWLLRSDMKPEDLSILHDPARMLDTVSMTAQKESESFMLNGPHDLAFRKKEGVKSFKQIFDEVAKKGTRAEQNARILDFVNLLYSTRAIEQIDRDKRMPLPKSDYIRTSENIIGRSPELVGKMREFKDWTDSLIDLLVEAAQVNKADAQRMKDYGTVYIPFVRIIRESVSRFAGGRGVAEQGTGVKAFREGSREELVHPVKAMEDVARSMIVKARKALVMRSLYNLMLRADVGGLVTQVPKGKVANRYRLDQIMRQMKKELDKEMADREGEVDGDVEPIEMAREELEEAFGVFSDLLEANELTETLVTLFGQKDLPFGEKEPIIAMVPRLSKAEIDSLPSNAMKAQARKNQGKMIWLQVDPAAFEALMGIDQPISRWSMGEGLVQQAVSLPKEVLRTFATDANPAFVMANMLRDAVFASVFDREGKLVPFKGFAMLAQGGYLQLRYGSRMTPFLDRLLGEGNPEAREMWEMFQASGASTSSFFNEGMRRQLRGEIQSVTSRTMAALDSWKRAMAAPESWIRLAEFSRVLKRARSEGKTELEQSYEALEAAREVTVNFARAGDLARAYNQMTPYFSATMAGQRRMLRGIMGMEGRSDEERAAYQRRVWAQALANITLPTVAAWLMVKDEEWYQDLPEWRKRNFINFKIPGTEEIASLPLPFEVGTIFGSLPVAWLEKQTGGNPINMGDAFLSSLFPYFEHTSSLWPAFLRPVAETYTGKDFFRNRPLTPFWIEKTKVPAEQVRQSTTKSAQTMFEVFGRFIPTVDNPIELEQLLGGYTAGFSTTLMRAADEIFQLKDHPGLSANPFGRFLRQTQHGASRAVDDLYSEGKRIEQIAKGERTGSERTRLTRINRAKQEFARIRREVAAGRLTKQEADERMFRIAYRIIGRNQ